VEARQIWRVDVVKAGEGLVWCEETGLGIASTGWGKTKQLDGQKAAAEMDRSIGERESVIV
jgi:hypothetical protein